MKKTTYSLLLAGLMAAGGIAQAQTASATADVPVKAGEASTMTQGKPNAVTTNQTAGATTTKSEARNDAKGGTNASATVKSPAKAGEASTMVNGKPNANPDAPTVGKSRAEVKADRDMQKATKRADKSAQVMGNASAGKPAGVPAVAPAGTPSVQEGGTPK